MRPDLWYPGVDATFMVDAAGALVICSLALGIQASLVAMGWRMVFKHKAGPDMRGPSALSIATATLSAFCLLSEILYCVGAVLQLRIVQVNLAGGPSPSSSATKAVSCVVAVAMQCIVLLADALLIYRCWVVFSGRMWVFTLPAVPFVLSLGLTLFSFVQLIRYPTIEDLLDELMSPENLMTTMAPHITAASSVIVNSVVTIAIAARIIVTRQRCRKSAPEFASGPAGLYLVIAIMVESALPSTLLGIYATLAYWVSITWGGVYVARMTWVVCTGLAPQFILIRVLRRRDLQSLYENHDRETSIRFARSGDGDRSAIGKSSPSAL